MRPAIFLLVTFLLLLPSLDTRAAKSADSEKTLSVAVFDIRAKVGIEQASVDIFGELIQARLRNNLGFRVIGRSDIEALIGMEKLKDALACETSSCLAQVGGALGVDEMIVGSLAKLGSTLVISLKRIDPNAAGVLAQATKQVKDATDDALVDVVAPMVAELYPDVPQSPESKPPTAAVTMATDASSADSSEPPTAEETRKPNSRHLRIGFSLGFSDLVTELDEPGPGAGAWIEPVHRLHLELLYDFESEHILPSVRYWALLTENFRAGPVAGLRYDSGLSALGVGACADTGLQVGDAIWIGARLDVQAHWSFDQEEMIYPITLLANVGYKI